MRGSGTRSTWVSLGAEGCGMRWNSVGLKLVGLFTSPTWLMSVTALCCATVHSLKFGCLWIREQHELYSREIQMMSTKMVHHVWMSVVGFIQIVSFFFFFSSSAKLVPIFLIDTDFENTHRKIKNTTHPTCATTSPSTICAASALTVTISRNTVWNAIKREQYSYKQDNDDLHLAAGSIRRRYGIRIILAWNARFLGGRLLSWSSQIEIGIRDG